MILQLSIFLENEKGRLADVMRDIAEAQTNVHSLFVADTESFGVVRILCDKPQTTAAYLKDRGWRARVTEVLAVSIPNEPGGLSRILDLFGNLDINLEYVYCYSAGTQYAVDVLKIDNDFSTAELALREAGFMPLDPENIYELD